jgi:hypothetical protein
VLLRTQAHQRAFLFNGEHGFLAELDDDGFAVDNLVRAGTPCPSPPTLPLPDSARDSTGDHSSQLKCYCLA